MELQKDWRRFRACLANMGTGVIRLGRRLTLMTHPAKQRRRERRNVKQDHAHVLITGAGREGALGFALVQRYLEHGDEVIACSRKRSPELERLGEAWGDRLHVLILDVARTDSVEAGARQAAAWVPSLETVINNAVTTSPDTGKELEDANLDDIPDVVNVGAVGPLRVVKAFLPLLRETQDMGLIVNISSEAGSIGKCYRTTGLDYGMTKAALNMATVTLHNTFAREPKLNVFCVHPGWVQTKPENAAAPFRSYDQAEVLRELFETKRYDKTGPRFVTYEGKAYPW